MFVCVSYIYLASPNITKQKSARYFVKRGDFGEFTLARKYLMKHGLLDWLLVDHLNEGYRVEVLDKHFKETKWLQTYWAHLNSPLQKSPRS